MTGVSMTEFFATTSERVWTVSRFEVHVVVAQIRARAGDKRLVSAS
jgi:hypothetical protein